MHRFAVRRVRGEGIAADCGTRAIGRGVVCESTWIHHCVISEVAMQIMLRKSVNTIPEFL